MQIEHTPNSECVENAKSGCVRVSFTLCEWRCLCYLCATRNCIPGVNERNCSTLYFCRANPIKVACNSSYAAPHASSTGTKKDLSNKQKNQRKHIFLLALCSCAIPFHSDENFLFSLFRLRSDLDRTRGWHSISIVVGMRCRNGTTYLRLLNGFAFDGNWLCSVHSGIML